MLQKKHHVETGIIKFCIYLFLTIIVALFLNLNTVTGWTGLAVLFAFPISLAFFLVLLVIALCIKYIAHRSWVWVDMYFAGLLILIQTFVILFSIGDCGDNSNQVGNYMQRILTNYPSCIEYSLKPWFDFPTIASVFLFNMLLLAIFIIKTLITAHPKASL